MTPTGYTASFEPAMRLALAEAGAPGPPGVPEDIPVGAVILDEAGAVVARARNRREADRDPTAHAEIVAIRQAAETLGRWRLTGLTLGVTLEPCPMWAGAVTAARLARLGHGAPRPQARAAAGGPPRAVPDVRRRGDGGRAGPAGLRSRRSQGRRGRVAVGPAAGYPPESPPGGHRRGAGAGVRHAAPRLLRDAPA